jgi:hypothetical protein
VNVTVASNSITIQMNLSLQENITNLMVVSANIGPENSSAVLQPLAQPFNSTIQSYVPGAKLSSLDLEIESSNNTGIWNLVENYSITVTGANTNSGSNIQSNLGFVSMNLTQPLQFDGMELNNIGPAIILPALESKVAEYSSLDYYIDGSNPSTAVIPEVTTSEFSLFDFTWVPQVSTWTESQNVLGQTTRWTYDPTFPRYNLTIGIPSPEGILIKAFTAVYNPSFSVTVPANAWINGNTVSFDVSTPAESIMPLIAGAALIVAISAVILDRRFTRTQRVRKKR